MKDKLVIIGAGGHGKVCADIALKMNKWKEISFLDDDETKIEVMGIKVIGTSKEFLKFVEEFDIFVAIGDNNERMKFFKILKRYNASIPTLIHPKTIIGEQVNIGSGTVLMAGSIVNCCTKIGKGCIINTAVTIDHDNFIGDFVHISPGANLAGNVTVSNKCWLGIGSIISNNIFITDECIIGAGAVVVKSIKEKGVYVGVPAKKINI